MADQGVGFGYLDGPGSAYPIRGLQFIITKIRRSHEKDSGGRAMSHIFYNSKTKQAHPWVFVTFIVVPLAVFFLVWFLTRQLVDEKTLDNPEPVQDIFENS